MKTLPKLLLLLFVPIILSGCPRLPDKVNVEIVKSDIEKLAWALIFEGEGRTSKITTTLDVLSQISPETLQFLGQKFYEQNDKDLFWNIIRDNLAQNSDLELKISALEKFRRDYLEKGFFRFVKYVKDLPTKENFSSHLESNINKIWQDIIFVDQRAYCIERTFQTPRYCTKREIMRKDHCQGIAEIFFQKLRDWDIDNYVVIKIYLSGTPYGSLHAQSGRSNCEKTGNISWTFHYIILIGKINDDRPVSWGVIDPLVFQENLCDTSLNDSNPKMPSKIKIHSTTEWARRYDDVPLTMKAYLP